MSGTAKLSKEISLQTIITDIIKIPGVNVYRTEFLKTAFSKDDVDTEKIINQGPIEANIYANKANERLRPAPPKISQNGFESEQETQRSQNCCYKRIGLLYLGSDDRPHRMKDHSVLSISSR